MARRNVPQSMPCQARNDIDTRPALRFLTCGSVDDGKSTLIGRLLYEQNLIFDDHLAALERDSKKHGTVGVDIDFALLLDGLKPSASRGSRSMWPIVIFRPNGAPSSSPTRQAMSNIPATWRPARPTPTSLFCWSTRARACSARPAGMPSSQVLLGIRYVVLAVNKIDLVDFDQAVFDEISSSFVGFAAALDFKEIKAIPISARYGDNVSSRSAAYALVSRASICSIILRRSMWTRTGPPSRFGCRCNGSIGRIPIFAVFPGQSSAAASSPATRLRCCLPGRPRVSRHHRRRRRSRSCARPAMRSPSRLPMKSTWRAAIFCGCCATAPRSPTNSRPTWSGCRASKLLPGRSYLMKINTQDRSLRPSPSSSIGSTSTRSAKLAAKTLDPERSWHLQSFANHGRSHSILTRTTVIPAPSF